ncbi:MAG: acyl-CoA hydrolase [Bacillota bacterium]|nr:MAG: acyl-CoA hydrolase [Bacillota bacterium]MBS3950481.1 acyl-CoA thioesterase [Peptococcaceae bacterium]
MRSAQVAHLVKAGDLNHHGTLFAGRMAEWFVEACFICGARITEHPESIVCLKMHGLRFNAPANKGDIITIDTQLVKAGRTSFIIYGRAAKNNSSTILADGFITFVYVDHQGKPKAHNLVLVPAANETEASLRENASKLS